LVTFDEVGVTGLDWVRGTREPLDISSARIETRSWADAAIKDRVAFDKDLRASGLSEEFISEALAVRDAGAADIREAAAEASSNWRHRPGEMGFQIERPEIGVARRTAFEMLGDWWNRRVTVVESRETVDVTVPLFVLGTPSAPGCTAEWTNEITSGTARTWKVTLAGSGFGSDVGSTYIKSANFSAVSGETKLIFWEVSLGIEHIEIHQRAKPPVRTLRLDFTNGDQTTVAPGLLLLDPDAMRASGEFITRFPLSGDPTGAVATFKEKYAPTAKKTNQFGLTAQGLEVGLSAVSDFASSVEIKYALTAGTDYWLFCARDGDGYLFGEPT
jgi:hypothetical protein